MKPIVRVAGPDDANAVANVLAGSYRRLMARDYDVAVLERALPFLEMPNPKLLASGTYYVAEVPGHGIVGCGGWMRESPTTGRAADSVGYIRRFAVHADWASRGFGRAIYQHCEATARSADIRSFECRSTLNGERFYQSLGFQTFERFEIAFAPDVYLPAILMRRTLG